ncbi:6469_t:CDS:2 [Entrophospora sp. SA101]|nr:6469_t:CDS:2 [Entrophospora sp. SA101]
MIALYNGYLIKEAQQYCDSDKKRSTPSIEKGKQLEIIIEIEDILTIKLVFTLETELSIMDACEFDILEIDSYCTNPNYPMDMESSFNSITNSKPIELAPDTREIKLVEDQDYIKDVLIIMNQLSVRSLEFGDVIWMAKGYGSTTQND